MRIHKYWCVECSRNYADNPVWVDVELHHQYYLDDCERCGYAHMHYRSNVCAHEFPLCRYDIHISTDTDGDTMLDIDRAR